MTPHVHYHPNTIAPLPLCAALELGKDGNVTTTSSALLVDCPTCAKEKEVLYRVALEADTAFSDEGHRVFGTGWHLMRYKPEAWPTSSRLSALAAVKLQADAAWLKVVS